MEYTDWMQEPTDEIQEATEEDLKEIVKSFGKDMRMALRYKRLYRDAYPPILMERDSVGLDVYLIHQIEPSTSEGGAVMFGTGLCIQPPDGFYYMLVPRSSLSKTGWAMANSVGIIDPSYRGEIKVARDKILELQHH